MRILAALSGLMVLPAAYASLVHQYDLNNSYSDNFSGPSLSPNGGTLGATQYTLNPSQGLSLSNTGLSGTYTIDMMITLDPACAGRYCKLVDFKNGGPLSEAGIYRGTANTVGFWPTSFGSTIVPLGTSIEVTIQRDGGTNVLNGFLDGGFEFTMTDAGGAGVFDGPNNIMWFMQDDGNQGVPGEHPTGSVDWIRIYDSSETPGTYQVGEGLAASVPEPGSFVLIGIASAFLLIQTARRKTARCTTRASR